MEQRAIDALADAGGEAVAGGNSTVTITPAGPAARSLLARMVAPARGSVSRRLLGLADLLASAVALVASTVVIGADDLTWGALAVPPTVILLAKAMGLYDRDAQLLHKTTLDEIPKLAGLSAALALLLWLVDGVVISGDIGRAQVVAWGGFLFLGMIALRAAARAAAVRLTPIERCLFIGDAAAASEIRETLAMSPSVRATVVGRLPAAGADGLEIEESPVSEQIRELIVKRDVHRIILGPDASSDDVLDAVRGIEENAVKVSILPNVARLATPSVELDRLHGLTLLGVRRFEITVSSRFIKRAFDLVGSTIALILLSPVLLVTAVAIRLDSRGGAFFRQTRGGRHGMAFRMLKFRSMVDGADEQKEALRHLNEADGVFKIANDPRITRVGRVIRRLHIDELPQLVNVLRGEMSLVGPRPLPLDEDRRIEGWHRRRLDLRPGITGPWQVLGSARISVHDMVKLDYQYVAEWSLWNDLRILLLTFGHIARRRGQ